jgi:DNA-binding beta-propeller fold protein YncE
MNKYNTAIAVSVVSAMLLSALFLSAPSMADIQLPELGFAFAAGAENTVELQAVSLPNGQYAYKMLSHEVDGQEVDIDYSDIATIPGPTIIINEGESLDISVDNELGIDAEIEVEGFDFGSAETGTYVYKGEEGSLLGLFGAIIVNDDKGKVESYVDGGDGKIKSAKHSDLEKEFVMFMVGSTFWVMELDDSGDQTPLWTNPMISAGKDDLVRFHVLSIGPGHTFHLHAHRWVNPGTSSIIDTKLMEPGQDAHVFTVSSGDEVGAGHWQYHCHVFAHMEAGMHGMFNVVEGGDADSEPGANPHNIHPLLADILGVPAPTSDPGLVTFEISDEPGSWFKSARGDALSGLTVTESLELAREGDFVSFVMSDSETVHTITSLLWPTGAEHMPMDEVQAYKGGGIVQLTEPGLYVFTCKVHPYMFGAVIADDLSTPAVELGESIDLVQYPGLSFPTASDLATRLLRTFFIATVPGNWQDYSSGDTWHVSYPDLAPAGVLFKVGTGTETADVDLKAVLEARYGQDIPLAELDEPATPGVGEVWIDTQFEKTTGKDKPGTATAVDTTTWEVTRKVALDMNNPHNMWTDSEQSVIYQTEWFDNKLTTFERETGELVSQIVVGEAPSHVMTRANNDDIHVALNGEEGVAEILATTEPEEVERIIAMQGYGQNPTHPHAHWMSSDGDKMVTPNSFTGDSSLYGFDTEQIDAKPATGALPIATGMMPDDSKYYVANLLHSTISVIDMDTGEKIKDINGLEDYNPLAIGGTAEAVGDGNWPLDSEGADGTLQLGGLPIQTPVSPDGQYMVTANTLTATLTIVDTESDEIVATLFCDAGCHGVNFGAKQDGGYYAYVSSKFSNAMIIVDGDPDGDGNPVDAEIVGRILLAPGDDTESDETVLANAGMGGQGVLAVPNIYNGWVQQIPLEVIEENEWELTEEQLDPNLY